MIHLDKILLLAALLQLSAGSVQAFTSSLGVATGLFEPVGWSVGDASSTHQIWNSKSTATGNLPDQAYNTGGTTLAAPTLSVIAPGFRSGTSNFYSLSGDYSARAGISNHGPVVAPEGVVLGTHVIVQVGTSLNEGVGVFTDSLEIVDPSEVLLSGGSNGEALQISEVNFYEDVFTSFGLADYKEFIFEFWLPDYTEDFQIVWDSTVHSSFDTLRVDTIVAEEHPVGGSPFSLTTNTPGDFNADMIVDAADYTLWRDAGGSLPNYSAWVNNYGNDYGSSNAVAISVPEPSGASFLMMFGMTAGFCGWMSWFTRSMR